MPDADTEPVEAAAGRGTAPAGTDPPARLLKATIATIDADPRRRRRDPVRQPRPPGVGPARPRQEDPPEPAPPSGARFARPPSEGDIAIKTLPAKIIAAALAALAAGPAAAQPAFPARPVSIVVPFPPGGITDGLGRLVAARLGEKWKQNVVVENKAGGGTIIGTQEVVRAAPDGHTLLLTSFGYVMNQILVKNLPYDSRSLAPLNLVGLSPNVLYLNPKVPASNVTELVAYAKAHPGKLMFASSGNATSPHVAIELFNSLTGANALHVPYRGTAPAITDVLGGQASGIFDTMQSMQYAKAGRLKAIAVASDQRLLGAPELPTFKEAGLPDMVTSSWFGFFVPAAAPESVRQQLFEDIQGVLRQPDVRARIVQLGVEPTVITQPEFQRFIDNELARWSALARSRGITLE